jgi:inner membrane transporter RhtA
LTKPSAPHSWSSAYPIAAPIATTLGAMICIPIGATIAKSLLPLVGAAGATALRMSFASLMLAIYWRPWRVRLKAAALRSIVVYGVAMGCMNLCFYAALRTVPLGIVVAVEFTGPLAVALLASSRGIDYLWITLAALGLAVLLPLGDAHGSLGGRVAGETAASVDPVGLAFALGAGFFWAIYIVFGRRAGAQVGGRSTAVGILIGTLVILPFGIVEAGSRLLSPSLLPAAIGVALLSSALPYSLEMFALPRIPTRTFGVLMSLEPALAAIIGFGFLGEHLTVWQWAAILSIMLATGGSAATSPQRVPLRPQID